MHKYNLKYLQELAVPWCHQAGVSVGVVHFFPTTLGANPIQANKHHNVLTISQIQINTSSKSKCIYKCSQMPNESY